MFGALGGVVGFLKTVIRTGFARKERADYVGVGPTVELRHEARLFFFGHVCVPFGKLECFGSGQLALLTAR